VSKRAAITGFMCTRFFL